MMTFGLGGLVLFLVFAVALCAHVVRTHQDTFWLWIILLFPWIGGLVYVAIIILPGLFRGPTARKVGRARAASSVRPRPS